MFVTAAPMTTKAARREKLGVAITRFGPEGSLTGMRR